MLPVALAVADAHGGASGRDVLTAVAVGTEICVRLALATEMSLGGEQRRRRVMSLTTQAATLAGSLVAARLAGLPEEQAANAFGVAYSSMPGNLQMLFERSRAVRVMQGVSAQLAVQSAELAALGIDGPRRTLEGPAGLYQAYHRSCLRSRPAVGRARGDVPGARGLDQAVRLLQGGAHGDLRGGGRGGRRPRRIRAR
jgi:2-methylcitrate dehydratase PrpD